MKRAQRAALAAFIIAACGAGSAAAQQDPWDLHLEFDAPGEAMPERPQGGMWPGNQPPGVAEAFERFQLFERAPGLFDLPIRPPVIEPEGPSLIMDTMPVDPRYRRARRAPHVPVTPLPIAEEAPAPTAGYLPHEGQPAVEPADADSGLQWAGPPQEVTFN